MKDITKLTKVELDPKRLAEIVDKILEVCQNSKLDVHETFAVICFIQNFFEKKYGMKIR